MTKHITYNGLFRWLIPLITYAHAKACHLYKRIIMSFNTFSSSKLEAQSHKQTNAPSKAYLTISWIPVDLLSEQNTK